MKWLKILKISQVRLVFFRIKMPHSTCICGAVIFIGSVVSIFYFWFMKTVVLSIPRQ